LSVVDSSFDHPLKLEEHAAAPLAGGLLGNGYQCGMLWGATLAAGAQAYQLLGPGPKAETAAILASQRLVESFLTHKQHINCSEITEIEMRASSKRRLLVQVGKFFMKGGPVVCFSLSAKYARTAFREINSAYLAEQIEASSPPVSCAAMLAHRMGASDLHAVMAAGLAGGIGLSGGACGALGAVIWLQGMNSDKRGSENVDLLFSGFDDVIDRFMPSSNYEFECSKIVGRRFENPADHAGYLQAGGCAGIIEALAGNHQPTDEATTLRT
jgi:hypothetical protein